MTLIINELTISDSYLIRSTDGQIDIIVKRLSAVAAFLNTATWTRIVTDETTRSLLHTVYGAY